CFLDRFLLDFRNIGRAANEHARFRKKATNIDFCDKMLQHCFGYIKVGNHTVFKWTNSFNIARCSTDHFSSFLTDLKHLTRRAIVSDNSWLIEYNDFSLYMYQHVCRPEVNADITIKHNYVKPPCFSYLISHIMILI